MAWQDPGVGLGGWDRSLLEFGEQGEQFGVVSCLSCHAAVLASGDVGELLAVSRRIDFTNLRGLDSLSYADGVGLHSMTPTETLILPRFKSSILVILAVYGWHRYYLVDVR